MAYSLILISGFGSMICKMSLMGVFLKLGFGSDLTFCHTTLSLILSRIRILTLGVLYTLTSRFGLSNSKIPVRCWIIPESVIFWTDTYSSVNFVDIAKCGR